MTNKLGLFDILKSVTQTKKNVIDHEEFEKSYNPFMVNRFLSASIDTLFFASTMDQMSHLPKKLQYAFYFYGIHKKKRYLQYVKEDKKSEEIDNIIRCYQCNHVQALEYLELLNEEQIKKINKMYAPRIERE